MISARIGRRGRPLMFLALLAMGWIGTRLAFVTLWPEAEAPGAMMTQLSALDEPRTKVSSADKISQSTQTLAKPVEVPIQPVSQAPAAELVQGLEPAPPAHLEAPAVPLPAAAAHNELWMAASRIEAVASGGGNMESDKEQPAQEF